MEGNVYQKLGRARLALTKKDIKKSGNGNQGRYKYYELSDFMIPATECLTEVGLTSVFDFDETVATLTIYADKEDFVEFKMPVRFAKVPGATDIQSLGATVTYLRRYLYMTALDISETDVVENAPKVEEKPVARQASGKVTEAMAVNLVELLESKGKDKNFIVNLMKANNKKDKITDLTIEEYRKWYTWVDKMKGV